MDTNDKYFEAMKSSKPTPAEELDRKFWSDEAKNFEESISKLGFKIDPISMPYEIDEKAIHSAIENYQGDDALIIHFRDMPPKTYACVFYEWKSQKDKEHWKSQGYE